MTSRKPSARTAQRAGIGPPMRADARRNHIGIMEAAEAVFGAKGSAASTEEIARRAGVGIGTVFRHFPTKDALIEAIVLARVQRLVQGAETLLAEEDPATAFFTLFTRVVEEAAAKKPFTDLAAGGFVDLEAASPGIVTRLRQAIATLLRKAQEVGAVRADVRVPEIMALLLGAAQAAQRTSSDRKLQGRTLAILFDGLRPQNSRRARRSA